MLAEIIRPQPEEVLIHIAVAMALARENEEVETLIGLDQGIGHANGAGRVHIIINITGCYQ